MKTHKDTIKLIFIADSEMGLKRLNIDRDDGCITLPASLHFPKRTKPLIKRYRNA